MWKNKGLIYWVIKANHITDDKMYFQLSQCYLSVRPVNSSNGEKDFSCGIYQNPPVFEWPGGQMRLCDPDF